MRQNESLNLFKHIQGICNYYGGVFDHFGVLMGAPEGICNDYGGVFDHFGVLMGAPEVTDLRFSLPRCG